MNERNALGRNIHERNPKIHQHRSGRKFGEECDSKGLRTSSHVKRIDADKITRCVNTVKNRLKSSLDAAIDGESAKQKTDNNDLFSNDVTDSVSRQAEIDRIEEPGFRPSLFKSDADTSRKTNHLEKMANKSKTNATKHDRAMFGPIWAGKELEKGQNKEQDKTERDTQKHRKVVQSDSDCQLDTRYPLAHELLSQNAEKRNHRWKELFKERRKKAMDNVL